LLAEGLERAEQVGAPERIFLAHAVLAEWELLAGQPQAARARLEPLLDPPDREDSFQTHLWTLLAWAALDLEEEGPTAAFLHQALLRARTRQIRFSLAETLRIQARFCLHQERWADAQAALEELVLLCRAMPYPYAEAKALQLYGRLHLLKGESVLARERLEAARAILDRLGERLYAEQIEQALAVLECS
jgi:hypothetical protein